MTFTHAGKGATTTALNALVERVSGLFVADVYSPWGRALMKKCGWTRINDAEHPLYGTTH